MKLIATLTTLPSRIAFIEPVLTSILNQSHPPEEIHLQLPKHCEKEAKGYQLPDFIANYPQIKVFEHDTDYGPATNWLPALDFLQRQDVLLLIMDDDCFYPPVMVEQLMRHYRENTGRVYCSTGGLLKGNDIREFQVDRFRHSGALTIITDNKRPISVDTVQGFSLILFDINLIKESTLLLTSHDLSGFADDILLSGLFERSLIERVQIAPYQVPVPLGQAEINPIHGDGKLTKMTMKTFVWVQQHLKVWADYSFFVESTKTRKPIWMRVLIKLRRTLRV